VTKENDLRIRALRPDVIAIAADWAAVEGWDPGLAGTACFATVDPAGFSHRRKRGHTGCDQLPSGIER
jgi:hypothetical protein